MSLFCTVLLMPSVCDLLCFHFWPSGPEMDGVFVSCYPIFRYSIMTLHGCTVQLFIDVYNTIQLLMDLHILMAMLNSGMAMLTLDHHH